MISSKLAIVSRIILESSETSISGTYVLVSCLILYCEYSNISRKKVIYVDVRKRLELIKMIKKIEKQPKYSKKLGLVNKSHMK